MHYENVNSVFDVCAGAWLLIGNNPQCQVLNLWGDKVKCALEVLVRCNERLSGYQRHLYSNGRCVRITTPDWSIVRLLEGCQI